MLHGDAVFTPDGDSCILSGDDLLVALCDELCPQRAACGVSVFLTDVRWRIRPPALGERRRLCSAGSTSRQTES